MHTLTLGIKMAKFTYFSFPNNSHYIGIQLNETQSTYYYPTVLVSANEHHFVYLPAIKNSDFLDERLKHGLFKQTSAELMSALDRHNRKNQCPSAKTKKLLETNPNVAFLEAIVDEIDLLNKLGVAYLPK